MWWVLLSVGHSRGGEEIHGQRSRQLEFHGRCFGQGLAPDRLLFVWRCCLVFSDVVIVVCFCLFLVTLCIKQATLCWSAVKWTVTRISVYAWMILGRRESFLWKQRKSFSRFQVYFVCSLVPLCRSWHLLCRWLRSVGVLFYVGGFVCARCIWFLEEGGILCWQMIYSGQQLELRFHLRFLPQMIHSLKFDALTSL